MLLPSARGAGTLTPQHPLIPRTSRALLPLHHAAGVVDEIGAECDAIHAQFERLQALTVAEAKAVAAAAAAAPPSFALWVSFATTWCISSAQPPLAGPPALLPPKHPLTLVRAPHAGALAGGALAAHRRRGGAGRGAHGLRSPHHLLHHQGICSRLAPAAALLVLISSHIVTCEPVAQACGTGWVCNRLPHELRHAFKSTAPQSMTNEIICKQGHTWAAGGGAPCHTHKTGSGVHPLSCCPPRAHC